MSKLPPPPPPPPGRGPRQSGNGPQGNWPQGNGSNGQPGSGQPGNGQGRRSGPPWTRWAIPVLLAVLVGSLLLNQVWPGSTGTKLSYTEFITAVQNDKVKSFDLTNGSNSVSGEFIDGTKFTTTVRDNFPNPDEITLLGQHKVDWTSKEQSSNWLLSWASLLLPFVLVFGFLFWMNRRAQGQMGNVMSIGRSKAKAYSADKPSTTFADIAGYEGVKQEIGRAHV